MSFFNPYIRIKDEKFSDDENEGATLDEEKAFLEGAIKVEYSVETTTEVTNWQDTHHSLKLYELERRHQKQTIPVPNAAILDLAKVTVVKRPNEPLSSSDHELRRPVKQEKALEDNQRTWNGLQEITTQTTVNRFRSLDSSDRRHDAQGPGGQTFPRTNADAACQTDDYLAKTKDAGCQTSDLKTADFGCQTDIIAPSDGTVPNFQEVLPRVPRGLYTRRPADAQEEAGPLDLRLNVANREETASPCTGIQDTSQDAATDRRNEVQNRVSGELPVREKFKGDAEETVAERSKAHSQSKSPLKRSNGSLKKKSDPKCAQDTSQEIVEDVRVPRENEVQSRVTEEIRKSVKEEPSEETATDRLQVNVQSKKGHLKKSNGQCQKERVSKYTQDTLKEKVTNIPVRKISVQGRAIVVELRKRFRAMTPEEASVRPKSNFQSSQLMKHRKSRDEFVNRPCDRQPKSPVRKYRPYDNSESHERRRPQSRSPPRERHAARTAEELKRRWETKPRKGEASPCKRRREAEKMEAGVARRSRSRDRRPVSRNWIPRSPPAKRARSRTRVQAEPRTARSPSAERCRKLENTNDTQGVVVPEKGGVAVPVASDAVVVNLMGESQGRIRREMERLKLALAQRTETATEALAVATTPPPESPAKNPLCEPQEPGKRVEDVTPAEVKRATQTSETLSTVVAKPVLQDSKNSPGEPHNQGTKEKVEKVATPAVDKRAAPLQASEALCRKSDTSNKEGSENSPSKPSGKKCQPIKLCRKKRAVPGQTLEKLSDTASAAVSEAEKTAPPAERKVREADLEKCYYEIKQEVPEQTSQTLSEAANSTAATTPPGESPGPMRSGLLFTPSTVKAAMATQVPQAACNAVSETTGTENLPEAFEENARRDLELLKSWLALVQRANAVLSTMPDKLSPSTPEPMQESDTGTPTVPQEPPSLAAPESVPEAASDIAPKWVPIPELKTEKIPQEPSEDTSQNSASAKTSQQDAEAVPEGCGETPEPGTEASNNMLEPVVAPVPDAEAVPEGRGETPEPGTEASKLEPDVAPVPDAEEVSEAAKNKQVTPTAPEDTTINQGIRCNICNVTFLSRDSRDDHRQNKHRIPVLCGMPPRQEYYKCPRCLRGFQCEESSFGHVCYDVSFYRHLASHFMQ